jgi:hypothetical protein
MKATLITTAETATRLGKLDQARVELETHVAQNHGQTHLGHLITNPASPYSDSSGQSWPATNGRVSAIIVNGTTYYFPSQVI